MKTRTLGPLPFLIAMAVASLTRLTFAQTWQTVDDFRYFGHYTALWAMAKDPFGNVYAAGGGTSNNFDDLALITKSSDGGASWSVSDAFAITPHSEVCEYAAMTSDRAGNLYALGDGFDRDSSLPNHWFVRRSQDSGATWSTVLDVTNESSFFFAPARGIATDTAGNVYVAGPAWAVLKSADAGNSWAIVDDFNPGRTPNAYGLLCHPTLGIFVVGSADAATTVKKTTTYQHYWYVRRSLNGGATWTTVDANLISAPNSGSATRIGADPFGNIYVTGIITTPTPVGTGGHWIVRKGTNGGASWATVDDFSPTVGTQYYYAQPFGGVAADAAGNLFVAGSVHPLNSPQSGSESWTVRKLPFGSATWQTVDTYQLAPGHGTRAQAVFGDNFGSVFVGGWGYDTNGVNGSSHWLVRKLVP